MSKKENKTKTDKKIKMDAKATKRLVIVLVSILLGIAVIFTSVVGIVNAVRRRSYLISYENTGVDAGVASYLASMYKNTLLRQLASSGNVNASDTETFWNSQYYGNTTWGDMLRYYTENYIKQIVAANAIFDMKTKLTDADKKELALATREILSYRAGGSVEKFNADVAEMGFDYDDFKKATEMLYKADYAFVNIFGENGSKISSDTEYCDEFFTNYVRAKIIFIRTENTFVYDAEGNRVKDEETGYDKLCELTEEQKAERMEYIARLEECVKGINDGSVDVSQFDILASEISEKFKEGGESLINSGYYFKNGSVSTSNFTAMIGSDKIVNTVYSLDVGYSASVDLTKMNEGEAELQSEDEENANAFVGKCYILRVENESSAYLDTSASGFFEDFYLLASKTLYQTMLNEYSELVKVGEKWSLLDLVKIPKNSDYIARY